MTLVSVSFKIFVTFVLLAIFLTSVPLMLFASFAPLNLFSCQSWCGCDHVFYLILATLILANEKQFLLKP